ncbi:hypothetical protein K438DRAFT_1770488 [Mycena galopus ATCC 62051]|nr:hypothetical protein K438DRAFT_1770488 [Mycena galopus ATCC 62051]
MHSFPPSMTFSPCSSPLSDAFDMENFFDFDAASSDPIDDTDCEFPQLSPNIVGLDHKSIQQTIPQWDADYNPYQIEVDVDDIFYIPGEPYQDIGLKPSPAEFPPEWDIQAPKVLNVPRQLEHGGLITLCQAPELCAYSDSESCSSAPGSPSSYLCSDFSTPPQSPISCRADNDGCSDEDAHITSSPNPSSTLYAAVMPVELTTMAAHPSPEPFLTISFPSSTLLHSPRPVSPQTDVVAGLENRVQPVAEGEFKPPEYELRENAPPAYSQELESLLCYRNESPVSPNEDLRLVLDEDFRLVFKAPARSPSPWYNNGPHHRVGGKPLKNSKRGRKSPRCSFPGCNQTFTRQPDLLRHQANHKLPDLPKIFAELDERRRKWCLGCLSVLSREDSRRRHEKSCGHFIEYERRGDVRKKIFLPLPEIYAVKSDHCRLWCSKCYEVFPAPGVRYEHEELCEPPQLLDRKTYFPRAAPMRC